MNKDIRKDQVYRYLIDSVREEYKLNDEAHSLDHVVEVTETMLSMNEKLNLNIPLLHIYFMGLFHDIKCHKGREEHHNTSADYMQEYLEVNSLFNIEVDIKEKIVNAIREHRGSYKGEFFSNYSMLLSSADRGKLNFDKMIKRSFKYHKKDGSEDISCIENVVFHMKDKYGINGYARYPEIFKLYHSNTLQKLQKRCEVTTIEECKVILKIA